MRLLLALVAVLTFVTSIELFAQEGTTDSAGTPSGQNENKVDTTTPPAAPPAEEVKTIEATVVKSQSGPSDNTVCNSGEIVRRVDLVYGDPTTKVPCEVHYKKQSEQPGHDQVLYRAQNDSVYCESKAREFVQKLEGWGWVCKGE